MSETPPDPYGESRADPPAPPPPPPPPYGQPDAYGTPSYAPYGVGAEHPQATTVLILGILGLVVCGVLAPFAWVMGNRVVGEIDASKGTLGGRSSANAGRICGIIGTAMIALAVLAGVGFIVLFVVLGTSAVTTST